MNNLIIEEEKNPKMVLDYSMKKNNDAHSKWEIIWQKGSVYLKERF